MSLDRLRLAEILGAKRLSQGNRQGCVITDEC